MCQKNANARPLVSQKGPLYPTNVIQFGADMSSSGHVDNRKKDISIFRTAPFCFHNVSKYFSADNEKKARIYGYVYDFLVDSNSIDIDDILDINKYLMKKIRYRIMFGLIQKCYLDY